MTEKSPFESYIDRHSKLIEVIGVFGALTAFFIQANIDYVAIFTLLIFAILSAELMVSSKKEIPFATETPLRMMAFAILLLALLVTVTLYFLITLAKTSAYFWIFVIASDLLLMVYVNAKITKKFGVLNTQSPVKMKAIGSVLLILTTFTFIWGLYYSFDLANLITKVLSSW
jgi:hypothetical protein